MTVYVDQIRACPPNRKWRWHAACHLIADSPEELHRFAARLDLKRGWFQAKSEFPHYDLTTGKRRQALAAGAEAITDAQLVEWMRTAQGRPLKMKAYVGRLVRAKRLLVRSDGKRFPKGTEFVVTAHWRGKLTMMRPGRQELIRQVDPHHVELIHEGYRKGDVPCNCE